MTYVLACVGSVIVLVFAGTALSRYGDALAKATGLGRVWIGTVLIAAATSLPELVTGTAAVRLNAVDLAVGDLFGSSLANMVILAVIDLVPPRRQVLEQVSFDHALTASFAIALNALAGVLVFVHPDPTSWWVGPSTVILFLLYLAGTRSVHRHSVRERAPKPAVAMKAEETPLRRSVLGFAAAALGVLVSAPVFAWSAKGIAAVTGLGDTFIGTWMVGIATSLPELVACLAAVRVRAFDLAVGMLFGSNTFNMAMLLPLDLAQPGSLFATLDSAHALSALLAVMLMSLGLAAIVYRAKRRFAMLEPDSLLVLLAYCIGLWLLYRYAVAR